MQAFKRWTDQEIQYLKNFYPTKGCIYVARQLGLQRATVYRKAAKLGLKVAINTVPNAYLPREIVFIKKYYPTMGSSYVAKQLGRTPEAIYRKANELRVERHNLTNWSAEEIDYLKKWYFKKRPSEIAKRLKRSVGSVLVKARRIGLFKKSYRKWTDDEEVYLKNNFRKSTYKQIGKHLNRSARSIQHHVKKMKLVKVIEKNWLPWEKKLLSRFYGKIPNSEIAERLNRTKGSIAGRAEFQNLKDTKPHDYSDKEIKFIRDNYLKLNNKQIARKLKRTQAGIMAIALKLGLAGNQQKMNLILKSRTDLYSERELDFVRKNYFKMTNAKIAEKLNRSEKGLFDVAKRLGLVGFREKKQSWVRGNLETHYTLAEKNFISNNYLKMTNDQIGKKLNRTAAGIAHILMRLGLSGNSGRRTSLNRIKRNNK